MVLIRSTTGRPKYTLFDTVKRQHVRDDGVGGEYENFTIMLKDRFAAAALLAYAIEAEKYGMSEYAAEVRVLAARAGLHHPKCKLPD